MPVVDPASPLWAAVASSHRVRTRVEVWDSGQRLATLYPNDGTVTVDATRAVRRSLSMSLADSDGTLMPSLPGDLLAPFSGNLVKVWRGVTYPDGTYDEAPCGVFTITNVDITRGADGILLDVQGEDLAWLVSQRLYTKIFAISSGTNIATAIGAVLDDRYPSLPQNLATTQWTTPTCRPGFDGQTDPWAFCQQLANAAGQELFMDANGVATTSNIPNISGTNVVATFAEGSAGVMLDLKRSMSVERMPNGVRVSAEGTEYGVPWVSVAWDDDPQSPTYRDPAGNDSPSDVVQEFSTPLVRGSATDTDQTDGMASALLQTVIGQPLELSMVPNPALDVRDLIQVTSTRLGINTTAMVDSISLPLSAGGTMSVNARARRLTL